MFKIRCSAIGDIMTNPRSKSETLSQTAKTFVENWVLEQKFDRKKTFSSKECEKGTICEDASITKFTEYCLKYKKDWFVKDFWEAPKKNQEQFGNDFITGTPDIISNNEIIDIKTPWSFWTHPHFDDETDKRYWWQVQGYMELTGKQRAKIAFVLTDTPDDLLSPFDDWTAHKFENIDLKYRVKIYEVARDQEAIEKIKQRVLECREYADFLFSQKMP